MKPETKKFIKWGLIIIVVLIGYGRWNSSSLGEKVATLASTIVIILFYLSSRVKEDERKRLEDFKILQVRDEWLLLRMEYLQNPEEFKKKYENRIDNYMDFPLLTQYFKEHLDDSLIFTMEREGIPHFQFYD